MPDDAPESTAIPPAAEAAPAVTYDIDESAPAAAPHAAAPAPAEGPSSAVPDRSAGVDLHQAMERAAAAERTVNEMRAQMAPFLERHQRDLTEQAAKPPVSLERLESGEATAKELLQYLTWQTQQQAQQLADLTNVAARRAAAESYARGAYTATALGEGHDYDSLRARHLEPAYRQNPAVRQAMDTLSPDNPALAEMVTAAFFELREVHKGNELAALKALFDGIGARAEASAEMTRTIDQAARRGADQVLRGQGPGAQRRKVDSDALWNMSDAEFRAFERQHAGTI